MKVEIAGGEGELSSAQLASLDAVIYAQQGGRASFLRSVSESYSKKYNMALSSLDAAIGQSDASTDAYDHLYKAFYLMNRSVLRAEMIDFIASMQSNVQVLTMDDSRNTRARVKEHVSTDYDYSEAIADAKAAIEILDNIPYLYFNLGNLHCLSSEHLASIENYTRAISLFPYMGDAYFNRGLVLIYLKDKEKGCIDLSRAGELGVAEAYAVIKKYCEEEIKQ